MRLLLLAPIFFLAVFVNSCRQIPNEGIPFYMKIDSAELITNSNEGDNTHAIIDLWVEANASNLGAYEMPVTFPVLMKDELRFVINPGVKESGQSNSRVIYPFFQPDTFTLTATPGQTYTHIPTFRYRIGATFPVLESFDTGNSFTGVQIVSKPDTNVRYGTSCAKISVTAIDSNEIGTLINGIPLPAGFNIWMELDYKAEVPFYIGYYGTDNAGSFGSPIYFVNQKETWSKLYINLTNIIGSTPANTYQIYFEALRPFGTSGGSVYLDNIKVVHL